MRYNQHLCQEGPTEVAVGKCDICGTIELQGELVEVDLVNEELMTVCEECHETLQEEGAIKVDE